MILYNNKKKWYKRNRFINSYLAFSKSNKFKHRKAIIMTAIQQTTILILIIFSALLFSCKNNQDGYSDEIDTAISPLDSAKTDTDSIKTEENISTNIETTQQNGSKSTAGTGSGPGESSQDGSTYTSAAGLQKDSLRLGRDTIKNKKK